MAERGVLDSDSMCMMDPNSDECESLQFQGHHYKECGNCMDRNTPRDKKPQKGHPMSWRIERINPYGPYFSIKQRTSKIRDKRQVFVVHGSYPLNTERNSPRAAATTTRTYLQENAPTHKNGGRLQVPRDHPSARPTAAPPCTICAAINLAGIDTPTKNLPRKRQHPPTACTPARVRKSTGLGPFAVAT
ncbi:hypothetical protein PMIN06_000949 [Paraphaeosphaeria minitans]